ncbi:MAG: hypothetical protein QXS02_03840 [Candidatus Thermoplasmatota archaeon]
MNEKICSMCKNKIDLEEHQNGLVFEDVFFVCEDCCAKHASSGELDEWSRSIMREPSKGMPIGLWLIHEQNKDKPLFSMKKI